MSSLEGDLTRKQRREQAREERRLAEEAARETAARRRRLIQLGAALGIAIVVIVVAVIISTNGGKKAAAIKPGTPQATATTKTVDAMLSGLPQSGETLGKASAPVTITFYGDLECPICQEFDLNTVPTLVANDVRAGKVKVTYQSLETATRTTTTFEEQQSAALAAGKQNRLWNFIETFYHEQGAEDTDYMTPSYLDGLAKQVTGLNYAAWSLARTNPALTAQVEQENNTATGEGLNSTPSIVISGPKGTKVLVGAADYSTLEQNIDSVA